MSGEYISQEAAIKSTWMILEGMGYPRSENRSLERTVEAVFKSAPAADVVEVRHGMWGIVESWKRKSVYRCSECGNFLTVRPDTLNGGRGDMNYCPNCGARMDGGQDDV